MISPSQIPLPGNAQRLQQTYIHGPGGIRTRNPSKRAVADPRLRPGGHWDRRKLTFFNDYYLHSKISVILLYVRILKFGNVHEASPQFNCFASHMTESGAKPPIQQTRLILFSVINPSGLVADHSFPPTAEIKNKWSHTSALPICFQCVDGVNFFYFDFLPQDIQNRCTDTGRNMYFILL